MDLQFKSIPFEVKAAAPDGSTFEGKASPFWNIDSYGEIVDDKAFDIDLPEFMEDGFIGGLNHDWDSPVGRPLPGTGPKTDHLHIMGSVIDTAHGMDVRKLLKAGIVRKLSIGFRTLGDMMLNDSDECMAYWESKGYKPNAQDMARCQMGARVLTRIKLYEVSPVTVPANDLAMITAVKAAKEAATKAFASSTEIDDTDDAPASVREYEKYLRDAGLSKVQAKQAVKMAKTLLRDVASGDAGTPETDPPADGLTPDAGTTPEGDTPPAPDAATPPNADAPAVGPPDAPPPAPGETADDEPQVTPPPAPTTTPEELAQLRPKSGPKPLPDDLLPETAAMRQRLTAQLHAQFIDIQDRASAWRD